MTYKVKLQQFEGPLPLLLELIEKDKLDITTVSLAQVTDDFLNYLENKQDVGLNNLSEFLLVASHLILIKSKALLPFFEFTKEEEEDIEDLEDRLKEYRRFKKAAQQIGGAWLQQSISFSKKEAKIEVVKTKMPDVSKEELQQIIKKVIDANKKEEKLIEEVWETEISLEERITDFRNTILKRAKVSFNETVKNSKNKVDVIVSFLAVLEMMKQKFVTVKQSNAFEDILIEKR